MKTWMDNHKTLARLIVLVLSPVLIPTMLIYIFFDTITELLGYIIEDIEEWWKK